MRTVMIPFGLRFAEPFEAPFPAHEITEAVLCERARSPYLTADNYAS
jgi:hypothetical protein